MAAARILETGTDCHRFIRSLDAGLADKDYKITLSFLRHRSLLYKKNRSWVNSVLNVSLDSLNW